MQVTPLPLLRRRGDLVDREKKDEREAAADQALTPQGHSAAKRRATAEPSGDVLGNIEALGRYYGSEDDDGSGEDDHYDTDTSAGGFGGGTVHTAGYGMGSPDMSVIPHGSPAHRPQSVIYRGSPPDGRHDDSDAEADVDAKGPSLVDRFSQQQNKRHRAMDSAVDAMDAALGLVAEDAARTLLNTSLQEAGLEADEEAKAEADADAVAVPLTAEEARRDAAAQRNSRDKQLVAEFLNNVAGAQGLRKRDILFNKDHQVRDPWRLPPAHSQGWADDLRHVQSAMTNDVYVTLTTVLAGLCRGKRSKRFWTLLDDSILSAQLATVIANKMSFNSASAGRRWVRQEAFVAMGLQLGVLYRAISTQWKQ